MKNNVLIIAEAGVNHNGNLKLALDLIDIAAESGADFIKFQTFKADTLVSKDALLAEYQQKNTEGLVERQYNMLKSLELKTAWYPVLIERCKEKGISFLSTPFDNESVDFLDQLGLPFFKIPSGEITNKLYLKHIASKGKPVILSTGMSNFHEVKSAIELIATGGITLDDITVLHCNTEYPTPFEDVNLLAMKYLSENLNVKVGYSDHTLGVEVPIAAVALGASVIEKHFTLDRNLPGPDHKASLEPCELSLMVKSIRNIEKAIAGSGLKEPSSSEKKNTSIARKSLHFNKNLSKGSIINFDDLIALRPGDGISPMLVDSIVGRRVAVDVIEGFKITYDVII